MVVVTLTNNSLNFLNAQLKIVRGQLVIRLLNTLMIRELLAVLDIA